MGVHLVEIASKVKDPYLSTNITLEGVSSPFQGWTLLTNKMDGGHGVSNDLEDLLAFTT